MERQTRLDQLLFDRGIAPSRTKAKDLVSSGCVQVNRGQGLVVSTKPGLMVDENIEVVVHAPDWSEFVSRSGAKLAGALRRTDISVAGKNCLDLGVSTGGFVDCLLQMQAAQVVGIDVGHDQTHEKLRSDERFRLFEGVNARDLASQWVEASKYRNIFDLITIDVSFISLELIVSELMYFLKPGGQVLALVKPQFEVGRGNLDKNGIVVDKSLYTVVEEKIIKAFSSVDFSVVDFFDSEVAGKDGNQEFFIHAKT